MQKRGQMKLVLWDIMALVVAAILILTFSGIIPSSAKNGVLERNFLANDIALLMSTIYSSPGDLEYVYVIPYRLQVIIKEGFVTTDNGKGATTATFAYNPKIILNPFTSTPDVRAIRIRKVGGTVTFSGIYDDEETKAISAFNDFVQFVGGNSKLKYDFDCKEEMPITFAEGYYIPVSKEGKASLLFTSETISSQEVMKQDSVPLPQKETGDFEEFFITSQDWEPQIAISRKVKGKVILLSEGGKWSYTEPTIEVNELPECEAEKLARKPR